MEDKEFNEKYEQLKKSKFKQQKLWGWRPVPTISCITIIYISFAVFFILFGILILVFNGQINEVKLNYNICSNESNDPDGCPRDSCITTTINKKMKKPIMIYYELDNFSQNHRAYLDSKSEKQLEGKEVSNKDLEKCDNILLNKDIDNNPLDPNAPAIPCGLMAKSYFQDKFCRWEINGIKIKPRVENIAYKLDKDKYGKIKHENTHWIDMSDEHFMIWMRPSPFSNPRKLWGVIEDNLEKGDSLNIYIRNMNYYKYQKYIILSTRNIFGGKSLFLGMCYIVFGILCLIASITFIIAFNSFHKKNSK